MTYGAGHAVVHACGELRARLLDQAARPLTVTVRLFELPITAEKIYHWLSERKRRDTDGG